jgi:hypothetical protein
MDLTESPRIALFDDWWPIHMGTEQVSLDRDSPDDWARLLGDPAFKFAGDSGGERYFKIDDPRANREVHRLTQFRTCAICRKSMTQVSDIEDEVLLLCTDCGYWGGRGFREWNSHSHAIPLRGVIGRYKPVADLDDVSTGYLVSHLRRFPEAMTKISPFRAETFVADLLRDYLDCEVHALGGRKDGGVDGYILANDTIRTIIQIKWRESSKGAESVATVREVAGTLLARGVPNAIIVSTRKRFSADAKKEAEIVSSRTVEGFGQLDLALYDYHRILDMLEISNARLEDRWTPGFLRDLHHDYCVFDGAAMISERRIPKS